MCSIDKRCFVYFTGGWSMVGEDVDREGMKFFFFGVVIPILKSVFYKPFLQLKKIAIERIIVHTRRICVQHFFGAPPLFHYIKTLYFGNGVRTFYLFTGCFTLQQ